MLLIIQQKSSASYQNVKASEITHGDTLHAAFLICIRTYALPRAPSTMSPASMPMTPYAHTGMPLMLPFCTRELEDAGCAWADVGACGIAFP